MDLDRNLSKGPFKGKGRNSARDKRILRIGKLSQELHRVRERMGDLMEEINRARAARGGGYFRARVQRVGGRFAVRMEWRVGPNKDSTFQLASAVGRELLHAMDPGARKTLIDLELRRGLLNHKYRVLFAERRSLRQLDAAEEEIGKLIAELDIQ